MTRKQDILESSIANFTKFGSKRFTLDDLAAQLGISKKTIYQYFDGKETLVAESLSYLLDKYLVEIQGIQEDLDLDAIEKVITIYKRGFEYLKYFKPAFLFGIKKYYPKADKVFTSFSEKLVNNVIYNLLLEAENEGCIKTDVDIALTSKLYMSRVDNVAFKDDSLFEAYDLSTVLNHLIIYNLRGITVSSYSNTFFE
ncbi:TetR/AcrR family transcriptional regulator [Bizionia argentinensis JUB59]|uniref:TetR/AcrR family transcriptional regulator n=1 Tax=Bizionia argentinensis JUB59 TaxID=1046627 RepID=G2EF76_9FLAO|nr:TetR/AcrR family transcriptional regulator [Bizionia argentinensis]EGV42880.1 TetR/AcrR family transcriptional regulator [Bizionia argentinensis JUB59]